MKTKTKLTVAIASVLSVVALAGTGYAGWVISQNAEGKVTVDQSEIFLSPSRINAGRGYFFVLIIYF